MTCLMTQRHFIVSTEDSYIHWHRLQLPEIVIGNEANTDYKLKVLDDIDQEYKFEANQNVMQTGALDNSNEPVAYMHYSRSFKKIIMGTQQGMIGVLAVEAEAINEDEEEDDNHHEKEKKVIVTPFVELGRFHTKKITGIKELGDSTQLVTISEDMTMAIWEATSFNQITRVQQQTKPTALDVSKDGKVAFVGSEQGILRVYDISNRALSRLLKFFKFYENNVTINSVKCSHDGKYVLVSSPDSDTVYILSQEVETEFDVYGHVELEGYVVSSCFAVYEG